MKTFRWRLLAVLAVFMAVAMTACSSGVSQADYDKSQADLAAAQADLATAQQTITDLQGQMGSGAPSIIVQSTVDSPTGTQTPEGWQTPAAVKANVQLLASYDTSAVPNAWDPAAHPHVFITSEGNGYAGFYSEVYTVAGFQIIDADTKQHVFSAGFDLGYESMGTPHGLGVSPDGRWIYVPTSDGKQPWQLNSPDGGRILVVDALNGQLHQVIGTDKGPHHIKGFIDYAGNPRVIVERQGEGLLLLDPSDDNRVVAEYGPDVLFGQNYQVDADPTGTYLYVDLVLGGRGSAPALTGAVAKIELESGRVTIIPGVGMYPNGFAFTADGKYTRPTASTPTSRIRPATGCTRSTTPPTRSSAGPRPRCLDPMRSPSTRTRPSSGSSARAR